MLQYQRRILNFNELGVSSIRTCYIVYDTSQLFIYGCNFVTQEEECGGLDWIDLPQDREVWGALVNVVMIHQFT
jgi:hypothetical protein